MGLSPGAYRSAKRSKELARRKKQEEKQKRRLARAAGTAEPQVAPEAPAPVVSEPPQPS